MEENIEKQEEKPSEDVGKIPNKHGIPTKVFIGVCISALVSFVPFSGYGYLRGYLWGVGFDSPVISPSIYDMVYFFIVAMAKVITELLPLTWSNLPYGIFFSSVGLVALGYTIIVLFFKYLDESFKMPPEDEFWDYFRRKVFESGESISVWFKTCSLISLAFSVSLLFTYSVIYILVIVPWFAGAIGVAGGQTDGKEYINDGICPEFTWAEESEETKRIKGCTQIFIDNGDSLFGEKVYETKERIYFITEEGAYEIDQNMKIISFKKYINRPAADS